MFLHPIKNNAHVSTLAPYAFVVCVFHSPQVEITTNSPQLKFRKLWPPADPTELEKV